MFCCARHSNYVSVRHSSIFSWSYRRVRRANLRGNESSSALHHSASHWRGKSSRRRLLGPSRFFSHEEQKNLGLRTLYAWIGRLDTHKSLLIGERSRSSIELELSSR